MIEVNDDISHRLHNARAMFWYASDNYLSVAPRCRRKEDVDYHREKLLELIYRIEDLIEVLRLWEAKECPR